jgi:DNA-binding XRE family transcriptional regulator
MPLPVKRALAQLGHDLKHGRIRRGLTAEMMAERAFITRPTLVKVEKGDPSVSLGIYATVLFMLGMADRIGELADVRHDELGLQLDEARLPQRVRRKRLPNHPAYR